MTGITSSTAAAWNAIMSQEEARSVGYVINADLAELVHPVYTVFLGQSVDSSAIILRYTVTGDLDLDGDVDDEDYTVVGAKYAPGVAQPHWHWGDLDLDGDVDNDDVTLFNVFYTHVLES
jgi:hypothetical protein